MQASTAATVTARLDRLPASRHIWVLVVLLSLGGAFEFYDLFMTGYVSPGLIREGIFQAGTKGLFGLTDQAGFASITFAGLFVGTIGFGYVADRYGRRSIFTFSLLWYAAATLIMSAQNTVLWLDFWRFVAGIGIGVELVTIDTYVAELVPKAVRGRAFAINQAIQFAAVPIVAWLSFQLVPIDPFGIAGWRWVAALPAVAAPCRKARAGLPSTAAPPRRTASPPGSRRASPPISGPSCRRRAHRRRRSAAAPACRKFSARPIGAAPS